jgi:hypothetical protein
MKLKLIQVGLGGMGTGVGIHCVLPSNDFEYVGLVEINEQRLLECYIDIHALKLAPILK